MARESRVYGKIRVADLDSGVRMLTLFNPARRNAIGPEMISELLYALDDAHADNDVVFCLPKERMVAADEVRHMLLEMGITVRMVPDGSVFLPLRDELTYFHDEIPMFTYYGKPFVVGQLFLKRCLDVAGALAGLGLTVFLFPFIALAIWLDSPGPLFFRQVRVGENGRAVHVLEIPFHVSGCGTPKERVDPAERDERGPLSGIRNDPRVTRVGKFLRRMSLDELPQFWNVLRGEMSLVGTRPPTPEEVAGYEYKHRKRICIKPGITGLWQVSGRNEIRNFDEVVRLDIEYIDQWSLWLDVKILMKTFRVLLARAGRIDHPLQEKMFLVLIGAVMLISFRGEAMIRRTFRVAILLVVFSLTGVHSVRAADPYGSTGGSLERAQSPYQGGMGYQGATGSYPTAPGLQSPYPQPSSVSPFPRGEGSSREGTTPSMEKGALPLLPPLPPEAQSAFEQMVSGKVEITRPQFDVIRMDPTIRFMNFMGVTPPGAILVPIKIVVPDPEKKESRPVQPTAPQTTLPTDVEAGYLVGPPDRIREMFHLLGISSPYSISMDLKHFGHDLFLRGAPVSSRRTGCRWGPITSSAPETS